MANVKLKSPLLRKLKKLLTAHFPPPATVKLEDLEGIIGVITSDVFAAMDSMDRQNLIGDIVDAQLSPEEQRKIQIIVGVTPHEGTGYLASVD